ncbi:hypothetical protein [Rugamonas aquatica]|uniref:Uncharacterized protein n=1 Tax=Rugamonas aquatica TaxID=2743357 RepID=A0A6A7N6D7_9BURK|nr:hypothetical protein [Rugamonas aquatica]MQA40549.1 hypothetical protein [Rugamonas aquatica]
MQVATGEVRFGVWFGVTAASTLRTALPVLAIGLGRASAALAGLGKALSTTPVAGAVFAVMDVGLTARDIIDDHKKFREAQALVTHATLEAEAFKQACAEHPQAKEPPAPAKPTEGIDAAQALQCNNADAFLTANAAAVKAGAIKSRLPRLIVNGIRELPIQLTRTVLSLIAFAPLVGGSSAIATAIPNPLSPVLSLLSSMLHFVQGALDWHQARGEEKIRYALLDHIASLRGNNGKFKLDQATQKAHAAKGKVVSPSSAADHNDPILTNLYSRIHGYFEQSQQKSLDAAKLAKTRSLVRVVFGALTTPIGAASLGLTILAAGAATWGIALIALPVAAAVLGLIWVGFTQHRLAADRKAAQLAAAEDDDQHNRMLEATRGLNLDQIEEMFLGENISGNNKFVAALLLCEHLRTTNSRRTAAARYLLATGMDPDTLKAVKHILNNSLDTSQAMQTIQAHLMSNTARAPKTAMQRNDSP